MTINPLRLPTALRQLPPMPQALGRALELIRDPWSQRAKLAQVLALDQGMTGLFLRMVNSAYYGLPRRITSLDEAIGYLGFDTVESLILAVAATPVLSRPVSSYMLDPGALWKHSIAVASGAEWIARRQRLTPASEYYVGGLLHDVGKLALDLMLDRSTKWAGKEAADEQGWLEIERLTTGHDHTEIGAVVVRSWNLPDRVVEAVRCHHSPEQAEGDPLFTAVVHVANAAALMSGIGLGLDGLRYSLSEAAVARLNWNEGEHMSLIGEMQNAIKKAEEMLKAR